MWLHIGKFTVEQLTNPLNRQFFNDIDIFAPTIIATPGIAFCVFIGVYRADSLHDGAADDVFRRDQFNPVILAM